MRMSMHTLVIVLKSKALPPAAASVSSDGPCGFSSSST